MNGTTTTPEARIDRVNGRLERPAKHPTMPERRPHEGADPKEPTA